MSHRKHLENFFLQNDGLMPFEKFMEEALYHPRFGYYSSNIGTVGRLGDFSTSPTLHRVLAQAVGRWAAREKKPALGAALGLPWHFIELGGGSGAFARDFLKHLHPVHRLPLRYHIVEASPPLIKRQKETIPRRHFVKWHEDMRSAIDACRGKALIFSNEFVDAFPPTVVRWSGTQRTWQELYLRDLGIDGIGEEFHPLTPEHQTLTSTIFGRWDPERVALEDQQRCEIHWSYQRWLQTWLPAFERGAMLTVDYGDRFPNVYRKRPKGTRRGYFQGVKVQDTELYDRFGHQDLTADVNFSDLIQWGETAGFQTIEFLTQRAFLLRMLPRLEEHTQQHQDPALEFIMSPYGAGDAFKVLWQRFKGQP